MRRKTLILPDAAPGARLLPTLIRALPETPAWAIRRALLSRDVRVNGRRAGLDALAEPGAEVVVYLIDHAERDAFVPVYEDGEILVVNKPAGVPSEGDAKDGVTMETLAARHAEGKGEKPPILCHRLDAMTGGLLLFAKGEDSEAILRDAFARHEVEKTYACVVRGVPERREATLTGWLRKDAKAARVKAFDARVEGAKEAILRYRVESEMTAAAAGLRGDGFPACARLEVALVTGRTHQIRVQLAHIGHPLLGDDAYGDWAVNRALRPAGLRLFAERLQFGELGGRLKALSGRAFEAKAWF